MVQPGEIEAVFPLTPLQQGMLLHSMAEAGTGIYLNQAVFELTGELDAAALRAGWDAVVQRHPALRAAFIWQDIAEPVQAVRPSVRLPWSARDWRGHPRPRRLLDEFLAEDRARGFDLATAPLMRLTLLRAADDRWWLVWTHHHLLLDGWSGALVLDEVFTGYHARRQGRVPRLAPPPPFWNYVAWLADRDLTTADRYWRERLRGFTTPTPVPGARDAPQGRPAFTEVAIDLPETTTRGLDALCRRHRITLATVVQAAWAVLLHRYTGQTDVVFGCVVAGRPAEVDRVDEMVGLLSNTLPVRIRVDDHAPLGEWLARVQAEAAEARDYEYSALARIQRHSDVPAGVPLLRTVVAVENYPEPGTGGADDRGGLEPSTLAVTDRRFLERPHYPLAVAVAAGARPTLRLYADLRWYEQDAVTRLGEQFAVLLAALASDPPATVGRLPLLTPTELELLDGWAGGGPGEPLGQTVDAAFAAAAARWPDRPALLHAGRETSYAELARQVDVLSGRLIGRGIRVESAVAVLLTRGPLVPVALLAAIRAGAVAVPIDPSYPPERIELLLRTSRAELVLCDRDTAGRLPTATVPALRLDAEAPDSEAPDPEAAARGTAVAARRVHPDNLVYIIHTSGSTGRPKGVMATHRGVLNHLGWLQRQYPIGPGDRVAQRTSVGFDMSVWELYWPLLVGACLLIPEAEPNDPERLAVEMTRWGATVAAYVPSALRAILAEPERRFPQGLRTVFVAGEALAPDLLRQLRMVTGARGMNGYGPTETSVVSVAWPLPEQPPDRVPIGAPISNLRAYVLDGELRQVPVGADGELYLVGAGIARGYLGGPGLTAERFLPDPFGGGSGRMYRTGDVVRRLPDGLLEYRGRVDDQVKLRGYRVELGEVEAVLSEHPAVAQCAARLHDEGGGPRLVGYLVARSGPVPVADLREFLASRLPEHMVPAVYVWLPELPTTTSGKIDRAALPAPGGTRPHLGSEFVAPGSPAQRRLAEIWAEVLGVDQVGVHDNFFELGGDSITSLLVVSKATRAGLRITARQIFDHQTVAELAEAAEVLTGTQDEATETGQAVSVALTPVQHWFFEHGFARPERWNMGVHFAVGPGVTAATLVDRLGPVVAAMVERHEALRTGFRPAAEGWTAEAAPASVVPTADVLRLVRLGDPGRPPDEAAWEAGLAEAMATEFALDRPPLLRITVVDGGTPQRLRLLLVAHHLVVDGVSWRVLLDDLLTGYAAVSAGAPVRLAPAGTPPSAWAAALRRLAATEAVAADAAFWREQTCADPDLPAAAVPGRPREADVRHVPVCLDAGPTRQLLRDVPRVYRVRVDELLLTAFCLALARIAGKREVVIAVEGHGREQHLVPGADLSRTVGWLTAIAPVRLRLPDPPEPETALLAVKEQLRAVPRQGLSHGLLRYLAGPTDAGDWPAPATISFNYLGQLDAPLAAGDSAGPAALPLRPAPEPAPPAHHPDNHRPHLLDITAVVTGAQLRMTFSHDPQRHPAELVEALAAGTRDAVAELVDRCGRTDAVRYSPSDFPESGLDQGQLDRLVGELTRRP